MRPTFLAFEASKRSLQSAQKALDITNSNLSNRLTPGYTRQRVDLATLSVGGVSTRWNSSTAKLSISGQGVKAVGVAQIRDPYIDKRYRETNAIEKEYTKLSTVLSEIEDVLDNYESEGLKVMLENFENKLHNYSAERPDSIELASIVRNEAYNITTMLKNYSFKLDQIKEGQIDELGIQVDSFNTILDKLANLNEQIVIEYTRNYGDKQYEAMAAVSGYGPNELLDARNLLVDELSSFANIQVFNNPDGSIKVNVGNTTVLDNKKTNHIIYRDYEQFGAAVLVFNSGEEVSLESGELKAYINLINGAGVYASGNENTEYGIPYYRYAIDQFAITFADTMNKLNGASEYPERAMFSSNSGGVITADNIRISDEWMKDPTMIAQIKGEDGKYSLDINLQNTNIAKLISGLNSATSFGIQGDFTGNFHEYISFYSNRLFQQIDYVDSQQASAETTIISLLESRDSVSAVDEQEEGINMLNYQKWFNASARMLTTLDEALDTIINNMGLVGR